MEINRSNIFEIVNKANLKPDKDYGQNFLVEPQISERIVDALDLKEEDKLIEVGPGLGSLTHFLSLKNCSVSAASSAYAIKSTYCSTFCCYISVFIYTKVITINCNIITCHVYCFSEQGISYLH